MTNFACGHGLPKSRVGANLAHIPQDNGRRCPDCQTKAPASILVLLKNMQKSHNVDKDRDPYIDQHLITYTFDRFVSQRKDATAGFKQQFDIILSAWGTTCHHMLDQKSLASLFVTVRGRWGSDIAGRALRAVGIAALKANGVFTPIEPEEVEILATLNRMMGFMRDQVAVIENFEQLEIIFNTVVTLRKLKDDITSALVQLEAGFSKWDAATNK